MTVATVCRATPALLLEEPSTFIIGKVNIESKFALFCNICRPFGLAKTLWYGISSCLKSTRTRNTQSRHVRKIQDISGKFAIRIRNSNSKSERYLLTKLVTLPQAHIIDMRIPFCTLALEFTTKVKPAAWQDLVKYC